MWVRPVARPTTRTILDEPRTTEKTKTRPPNSEVIKKIGVEYSLPNWVSDVVVELE